MRTPERLRGPMILARIFEKGCPRGRPWIRVQDRDRAREWIEGLQSANGGWGAFDQVRVEHRKAEISIFFELHVENHIEVDSS